MSLFMKNINAKENHCFITVFLVLTMLTFSTLIGCREPVKQTLSYQAVNKNDTAEINLNVRNKHFFGYCKINYNGSIINAGNIRGDVKGDTLIGSFRYRLPNTALFKSVPIALLKKNNRLIMGRGVISSYLNIPFYMEEVPIDYNNPKFVFSLVD